MNPGFTDNGKGRVAVGQIPHTKEAVDFVNLFLKAVDIRNSGKGGGVHHQGHIFRIANGGD